jgi:hypothetical protein
VNEHTIEVTDKVKDKQIDTQRMEVSPDGKTLTSTVFIPNREKPQIQVFEPEKAPVRAESAAGGRPRLPSKLRATRALACSSRIAFENVDRSPCTSTRSVVTFHVEVNGDA